MPAEFEIIIVYGTNKPLRVREEEKISEVKVAALSLFGIPKEEADKFVLKADINGREEQLSDGETVKHYQIRPGQKVKLVSGAPYGGFLARR
jgi:hypothetical protein